MSSQIVSVDLGPVEERVRAAERALSEAEQDEERRRTEHEAAHVVTEAARREVELARALKDTILQFAVVNAAPTTAPPQVTVVHPAVDSDVAEFDVSDLSTREAVLLVLRLYAPRVFALDELVEVMRRHGYTGTHNAVHVQLSRIRSEENSPVERVRQGHYRYNENVQVEPDAFDNNGNGHGDLRALADLPDR